MMITKCRYNILAKVQGQISVESVLQLVTKTPLSYFDKGVSDYAQ